MKIKKKSVTVRINPYIVDAINTYIAQEAKKGNSIKKIEVFEKALVKFLKKQGAM